MKAKLKVVDFRTLPNSKGFLLVFQTPFGEELATFFSKDTDVSKVQSRYPTGMIDIFDVVPYASKGSLGITVSAPLSELSEDELF